MHHCLKGSVWEASTADDEDSQWLVGVMSDLMSVACGVARSESVLVLDPPWHARSCRLLVCAGRNFQLPTEI
jgi:hypothetical protein